MEKLKTYIIFPEVGYTTSFTGYRKEFLDDSEVMQWIENTLDLSINWRFVAID